MALAHIALLIAWGMNTARAHGSDDALERGDGTAVTAAGRARIRPWLKALVGAGLLLVAWAAQANIFVADRRQQSDASTPLLRSVGLLHHAAVGVGGTAFLIGACHALTAYHVAFPKALVAATGHGGGVRGGPASTAEFLIGADPVRPGRFASRSRVDVLRAEARRMPAAPVNRRPGS